MVPDRRLFVFLVQILPDLLQLAPLEAGHRDRAPFLRSPGHGREHQLENRLFPPRVGDHLQASPLLAEQPLQQVGGADRLAVSHRHPQMRDAGLEVILEAGHRGRELVLPFPGQVGGETAGNGP